MRRSCVHLVRNNKKSLGGVRIDYIQGISTPRVVVLVFILSFLLIYQGILTAEELENVVVKILGVRIRWYIVLILLV